MRSVRGAPLVDARSRARKAGAALAALALLAAVVVVGVMAGSDGESGDGYRRDAVRLGDEGIALSSARCEHWVAATPSQREDVVAVLRDVVGGPTPYGRATSLSDTRAYALFERACAPERARGYLLYELYTRSSAFQKAPERFQ